MKYPLLPYSQLVFDMLKINPKVYTTRFSLLLDACYVGRLRDSIAKALGNHPIFSMRIDEEGMQYLGLSEDILHGPYHSVDFHNQNTKVRMDVAYNRILGDTKSELIVFEDVCRAYNGLSLLPDNYLSYLAQKEFERHSERYKTNRIWLEQTFGNISCPVRPKTDVPLSVSECPQEGTLLDEYANRNSINQFIGRHLIPLTALFSLASALAIMEYNETDEAALTWAYDGRETEDEQRIYGSLHRDVPFKISRKSKDELISQTRKQFREGISHSSYPFTLSKPYTDVWNYALNVLVRPTVNDIDEKIPFPFEVISPEQEPNVAYALLDVEILDGEQLFINYRYSATHYKESSIRRYAALVRKYVEWLLEE